MPEPAITLAGLDRVLAHRQHLVEHLGALTSDIYDTKLILHFDWPRWKDQEGHRFETVEGLRNACLDDCRRVLTILIRQDRFVENSLIGHAESGFLGALLDRLAALRGEMERGDYIGPWAPLNALPYGVLERAQGCLLGLLVGDALGAQVEFSSAVQVARDYPDGVRTMAGGGPFHLLPGQITDDGELALMLARSIQRAGTYDQRAAIDAYAWWFDSGPFDIGRTTAHALQPASAALAAHRDPVAAATGMADPHSQANGALMRVAPIGILGWNQSPDTVVAWARSDAALTHPHRICQDANALFTVAIAVALRSAGSISLIRESLEPWLASADLDPAVKRTMRHGELPTAADSDKAGWVLIALTNAFSQLFAQHSYEEALVTTLALGGDTDTNAAIAGALLGAAHGISAMPSAWVAAVEGCQPSAGRPGVTNPRPVPLWPGDARELAGVLARQGR